MNLDTAAVLCRYNAWTRHGSVQSKTVTVNRKLVLTTYSLTFPHKTLSWQSCISTPKWLILIVF